MDNPIKLHIGGTQPREGWKILNINPGPHTDYVGNCVDLGRFADGSVSEIYASHVYEHLGFREELPTALQETHRVLEKGGTLRISVPDFETLSRIFLNNQLSGSERFSIMVHIFGAQEDSHDFHKVGLTWGFLENYLKQAGFTKISRIPEFGMFDDYSSFRRFGILISLNVIAVK